MKKSTLILCLSVLIAIACCLSAVAHSSAAYSWYCVRNKDHKQPRLDGEFHFIEDHNAYYLDKNHGDQAEEKVVYLTFDVGYENGNVAKILDTLKEEQVPAAFFVLGNVIQKTPDLIKRMNEEGHTVCNHTYTHKNVASCTEAEFLDEVCRLEREYEELTGLTMAKYFRPPEGRFSQDMLKIAAKNGYKTIFWSFAYADWDNQKQMSPEAAKEKVLSNVHNGAVLLLHPTSATNAAIMKDVILTLKEWGYAFGTLDQLTA